MVLLDHLWSGKPPQLRKISLHRDLLIFAYSFSSQPSVTDSNLFCNKCLFALNCSSFIKYFVQIKKREVLACQRQMVLS